MIPTEFTIEIADWNNSSDRDACRSVRERVFVDEQRVPREDEEDEFDAGARHVLARDMAGNPIGTGRITLAHMIGRMAVLKDWRGRRVGTAMLNTLIEQARALAYTDVQMHAQTHAVPFYERFGFVREGDEFEECAIRHFLMRMPVASLQPPPRAALSPRPHVRRVTVESRQQALAETLLLIEPARRELCIYTRSLDPDLLDTEEVLEKLKHLAISGRGARIRVIVQDPRGPAQSGHRLIALAQRLTSAFELRTPVQEEDQQYPSAFLLNDTSGYYLRVLGNRFDGEAVNYAPGKHAQLREYFNQVWERCEVSDELRQLAL
ncbi:MAG TPA: GNAT family N-acetyltransferase [Rudaea sp.]|nr:GNAT family N-acetyltransferase [Rudaea sp.]